MRFIVCFTFYTRVLKSTADFLIDIAWNGNIVYECPAESCCIWLPKIKIVEIKKDNYKLKNTLQLYLIHPSNYVTMIYLRILSQNKYEESERNFLIKRFYEKDLWKRRLYQDGKFVMNLKLNLQCTFYFLFLVFYLFFPLFEIVLSTVFLVMYFLSLSKFINFYIENEETG